MEYRIGIPDYMWSQKRFKQYVVSYLRRNWPGMKPVKIHKPYWIVCEKRSD